MDDMGETMVKMSKPKVALYARIDEDTKLKLMQDAEAAGLSLQKWLEVLVWGTESEKAKEIFAELRQNYENKLIEVEQTSEKMEDKMLRVFERRRSELFIINHQLGTESEQWHQLISEIAGKIGLPYEETEESVLRWMEEVKRLAASQLAAQPRDPTKGRA